MMPLSLQSRLNITWSEMDPDEEFLDLVVIELRLDSLWVEMFLVLGLKLTVVTLEALEDSRDLREYILCIYCI